jgi:aryl-alcohol dehydrogenase-like predicted oxidoreductase
MRYLEAGTATAISRIGLGTWQFGSREWGYGQAYAGQEAQAIVRRAVELGVTLFDTAEVVRRPGVVAIPGASSVGQLESNVAAADIDLAEDEYQALCAAADRFRPVAGPAALPGLTRAALARARLSRPR